MATHNALATSTALAEHGLQYTGLGSVTGTVWTLDEHGQPQLVHPKGHDTTTAMRKATDRAQLLARAMHRGTYRVSYEHGATPAALITPLLQHEHQDDHGNTITVPDDHCHARIPFSRNDPATVTHNASEHHRPADTITADTPLV